MMLCTADSYSRKVLWLEVATTNNDSAVVAGYSLKAVKRHGNINTQMHDAIQGVAFIS